MDDKISTIKNFPQPQNVEKVRSFLVLCGHYKPFIRGFARITSPLTQLLSKKVPFHCNAPQDIMFNDLKSALINTPALSLPDYIFPFSLYTDTSALGLGGVLMQPDTRGKSRAIA